LPPASPHADDLSPGAMIRAKRQTKIARNRPFEPNFFANPMTWPAPIAPAASTAYPFFTAD
jgi:hypothetical protein